VTEGRVKNVAASMRAKLLRKMPELGEAQFQRLLRRFAIERFLYRLGRSPDRERFVLKGLMRFLARLAQEMGMLEDLITGAQVKGVRTDYTVGELRARAGVPS